jgi:hypothetical protein
MYLIIDMQETNMGYAELIARELENLPLDKQAEVLDFVGYLKTRQDQIRANPPRQPKKSKPSSAALMSM